MTEHPGYELHDARLDGLAGQMTLGTFFVCERCGATVWPRFFLKHEIFHDDLDRRFES